MLNDDKNDYNNSNREWVRERASERTSTGDAFRVRCNADFPSITFYYLFFFSTIFFWNIFEHSCAQRTDSSTCMGTFLRETWALCASFEILLCCKIRCQSVSGNNITLLCWHKFFRSCTPHFSAAPFLANNSNATSDSFLLIEFVLLCAIVVLRFYFKFRPYFFHFLLFFVLIVFLLFY